MALAQQEITYAYDFLSVDFINNNSTRIPMASIVGWLLLLFVYCVCWWWLNYHNFKWEIIPENLP